MSKCYDCEHWRVDRTTNEDVCDKNMTENLMTEGGCYRFNEADDFEDAMDVLEAVREGGRR